MGRWALRGSGDPALPATVELRLDDSRLHTCPPADRPYWSGTCVGYAPNLAPVRLHLAADARVWLCAGSCNRSLEPGGAVLRGSEGHLRLVRHPCGLRLCLARMDRVVRAA